MASGLSAALGFSDRLFNLRPKMADWSKLPYDIIHMIAVRLDAIEDFLAFSFVCHSWRSVYLAKQWFPGPQLPWLMLSDNKNSTVRSFFSLYRNKIYNLELPKARGRQCWGSPNGWLVTIESNCQIHLLNAFTQVQIAALPASSSLQPRNRTVDWYKLIHKAIVIKKPCDSYANEELLVIVIYGLVKRLAFCRPGSGFWVPVGGLYDMAFVDIAQVGNHIFAIDAIGTVVVFDIDGPHTPHPRKVTHVAEPPSLHCCLRLFLVESSGDLLMVCQYDDYLDICRNASVRFVVYSFDFCEKKWTRLEDLGDRAIFIGDNYSLSFPASKSVNCKCNSIYFAAKKLDKLPSYKEVGADFDLGVYNMANEIVERVYFGLAQPCYYSCPIWVTPTLS